MKRLRIAAACILGLVVLALAASPWLLAAVMTPRIRHISSTEDYPQLYAAQMKEIFGDYSIGPRMDGHIDGQACGCGYSHDEVDYYFWEITYLDSTGAEMHCVMNNYENFYDQQLEWMEQQIETHFFEGFIRPGFPDMQERGSYCYCSVGDIVHSSSGEAQWRNMDAASDWRQTFIADETIVPLHALEYDRVFLDYPVIISVNLILDDAQLAAGEWPAAFADAGRRMEQVNAEIIADTGGNVHMTSTLRSNCEAAPHAERYLYRYYLGGEALSHEDGADFDHQVFALYEGRFW